MALREVSEEAQEVFWTLVRAQMMSMVTTDGLLPVETAEQANGRAVDEQPALAATTWAPPPPTAVLKSGAARALIVDLQPGIEPASSTRMMNQRVQALAEINKIRGVLNVPAVVNAVAIIRERLRDASTREMALNASNTVKRALSPPGPARHLPLPDALRDQAKKLRTRLRPRISNALRILRDDSDQATTELVQCITSEGVSRERAFVIAAMRQRHGTLRRADDIATDVIAEKFDIPKRRAHACR